MDLQTYKAPGPIGAAFIESRGPIDLVMGPAGSGKTVASTVKGPHSAVSWFPVCRDGVIRVKMAVIRDTYRDLARTCLSSWYAMFPEKHPFTVFHQGGLDRPVVHHLKFWTQRGNTYVPVEFKAEFGAIGDANIESFIKGYEISFGWMNECDLLHARVPGLFLQRTGRYPAVSDLSPAELDRVVVDYRRMLQGIGLKIDDGETLLPRMIWGDMNPPDIAHWSYENCVEKRLPGWNLFKQPSGLSPQAENRAGKPRSSYEMEAATMNEYDVRRYVHGEFGYALDSKPVYPEFSLDRHVADETLRPVQGLPLSLGLDAGGSPAALIGQNLPNGQNRALREICSEPGTGPTRFAETVREVLLRDFGGLAIGEAFSDPSSFYGADKVAGELAWVEIVARILNVSIMPAPSNEPALRHDAVRWYLTRNIDGNTPAYLIDPSCKRLIGGFAAHYKLTKQATAGQTDRLVVAKNEYSHIHDAEQYRCLGHNGRQGVINLAGQTNRPKNVVSIKAARPRKADFSVWDV